MCSDDEVCSDDGDHSLVERKGVQGSSIQRPSYTYQRLRDCSDLWSREKFLRGTLACTPILAVRVCSTSRNDRPACVPSRLTGRVVYRRPHGTLDYESPGRRPDHLVSLRPCNPDASGCHGRCTHFHSPPFTVTFSGVTGEAVVNIRRWPCRAEPRRHVKELHHAGGIKPRWEIEVASTQVATQLVCVADRFRWPEMSSDSVWTVTEPDTLMLDYIFTLNTSTAAVKQHVRGPVSKLRRPMNVVCEDVVTHSGPLSLRLRNSSTPVRGSRS